MKAEAGSQTDTPGNRGAVACNSLDALGEAEEQRVRDALQKAARWVYEDASGRVRGPFSTKAMLRWAKDGWISPDDTLVSPAPEEAGSDPALLESWSHLLPLRHFAPEPE